MDEIKLPFIYKNAGLPNNKALIRDANAAASRIFNKLTSAGFNAPIMDNNYRERYYIPHLSTLQTKLRNCTYHVLWALERTHKPLKDVSLVDHGAGLGLIGLLAKEMGVGTVIYNDIDPLFLEAAKGIAHVAKAESDYYILGDVDKLINDLGGLNIDSLVSFDVLEHIYDLDEFFTKICTSPCAPQVLFMSSGANMFCPRYIRGVIPIHRAHELIYASKRMKIIKDQSIDITDSEAQLLCSKTRMLVRNEVEIVVKNYLKDRKIILPKKNGVNSHDPFCSNTVDPETGWWAEHLFNPYSLTKTLRKLDFYSKIKAGYYGRHGGVLNFPIRLLWAPFALTISAFYTVHAEKSKKV